MSIRRVRLSFENDKPTFDMPRAWSRDVRLSRRARGLLSELMSHEEGWDTSITDLIARGPEKRDALRTAIAELEQLGYLTRVRARGKRGRFEVDYLLSEPAEAPVNRAPRPPREGSLRALPPVDNSPSEAEPTTTENPSRLDSTTWSNPQVLKYPHPVKGLTPSSVSPHPVEAVDNSGDDDRSSSYPKPGLQAGIHDGVDWPALLPDVAPMFAQMAPVDLHAIGYEILGKASGQVQNPTRFVRKALINEPFVWQQWALERFTRLSGDQAIGFGS